ncbi:MAG: DNA polymerase III subunit delta [Candidatus Omnitrophota bacterium]
MLFIVEDALSLDNEIASLIKTRFGGEETETHRFDVREEEIYKAVEEAQSDSLFTPHKIVILANVDEARTDGVEFLLNYISRPLGDAIAILTASEDNAAVKKLAKALKLDKAAHLKKTPIDKIRKSVEHHCAEHKIKIDKKALDFFLQSCGQDAVSAKGEMDKLLLWAGDGGTITLQDCQQLLLSESEEIIWTLTDAVADKNAAKALQAFDRLLSQGSEPIAIIGSLTRTFRQLLSCITLAEDKIPAKEWPSKLGLKGYPLEKTIQFSRKFSFSAMKRGIALLRQADEDFKGGKGGAAERPQIMERLLIDLCRLETP